MAEEKHVALILSEDESRAVKILFDTMQDVQKAIFKNNIRDVDNRMNKIVDMCSNTLIVSAAQKHWNAYHEAGLCVRGDCSYKPMLKN